MQKNKPALAFHQQIDKAHGRGEERRVYIAQGIHLVEEREDWRDLHTLIIVGKRQEQTMFYISSLADTDPAFYSIYVRRHGAIENGLYICSRKSLLLSVSKRKEKKLTEILISY